jgi:hypothetical protein
MLRPKDTVTRERKSLDGLWRFAFDAGRVGRAEGWFNGALRGALEVAVPASGIPRAHRGDDLRAVLVHPQDGQAIGGAAAAYTIGFGGYVADAKIQPDSAVTAIKIAVGVVPAVVIGLALLIMLKYPLTETRFRDLVRDVAQRRAAREVEAARAAALPAGDAS